MQSSPMSPLNPSIFHIPVLKPDTNKVVADVTLKSQGHQNGNEAPQLESEVDIPDEGIAQRFQGLAADEVNTFR